MSWSKKILRQFKKFFGTDDIDGDLGSLASLVAEDAPAGGLAHNLRDFLEAVDRTYEQTDKMIELANHSLEVSSQELHDANRSIRALLDSLSEGFMIVDESGSCTATASRAARDLFGIDPVGRKLTEILRVPESEHASFNDWYEYLFQTTVPFEDLAGLGPTSFEGAGRLVVLDFKPIRHDDGRLRSVVLIAKDVTSEREAMREAEEMKARARMILAHHQDRSSFLHTLHLIEEASQRLRHWSEVPDLPFDGVIRLLHTYKGATAAFSMTSFVSILQELEGRLLALSQSSPSEKQAAVRAVGLELGCSHCEFMKLNGESLGISKGGERETREVPLEELMAFHGRLLREKPDAAAAFDEAFLKVELRECLRPLKFLAERQALRLGKSLKVEISAEDGIKVAPATLRPFLDTLVHVVNNSVDHGIESPDVRQESGKCEEGLLRISVRHDRSHLLFEIVDDGAGIDVEAVRAKLTRDGIDASKMTDQELRLKIFDFGVSTRETATDISGRGVGLSAVKESFLGAGGRISVESNHGAGTVFRFELPWPVVSAALVAS